MGNIMCVYKERNKTRRKNFTACLKRIIKLVDERYVVTFLYLHFVNGRPHNIFTVPIDLALLPVTWIESWAFGIGDCWDVNWFQGWGKVWSGDGPAFLKSLAGTELACTWHQVRWSCSRPGFSQTLLKMIFLGTNTPLSIFLIWIPSLKRKPNQNK